ncbi:MAG: hypothetical protein H6713_05665 [Myxococcales bacterium]|nr:hypothetical protein [Myxococcales bacterium]
MDGPAPLDDGERRELEDNLDRIFLRLRDAHNGLHAARPPADPALVASLLEQGTLPDSAAGLWSRWDGLDLGFSQVVLFSLAQQERETAAALAEGRAREGDRVIGERGRELFALCSDPYAEGADVMLIEEDGTRLPHSSRVDRMVLALLGELAVLLADDGEFRDKLFGDDGELTSVAERKLLRRHLDFDPDAPLARYRLARCLRRAGELRAAQSELKRAARCAPEFPWIAYERGRVQLSGGDGAGAAKSFEKAASLTPEDEPGLHAYFLAWACRAQAPGLREPLAKRVLELAPGFAMAQEASVREALEMEQADDALELLELGLAVLPRHLGLLALRDEVARAVATVEREQAEHAERESTPPRTPRERTRTSGGQHTGKTRARGRGRVRATKHRAR